MTDAMRRRASQGASECGLENVEVRAGDATRLPIDSCSVDVVISNGVLNLVPEKERAVAEIARVRSPRPDRTAYRASTCPPFGPDCEVKHAKSCDYSQP